MSKCEKCYWYGKCVVLPEYERCDDFTPLEGDIGDELAYEIALEERADTYSQIIRDHADGNEEETWD